MLPMVNKQKYYQAYLDFLCLVQDILVYEIKTQQYNDRLIRGFSEKNPVSRNST